RVEWRRVLASGRHQPGMNYSGIVQYIDVLRPELGRRLQYIHCIRFSPQFDVAETQIEIGASFATTKRNCLFQRLYGFLILVGADVDHTQKQIGCEEIRLSLKRVLEGLDGFFIFSLEIVDQS